MKKILILSLTLVLLSISLTGCMERKEIKENTSESIFEITSETSKQAEKSSEVISIANPVQKDTGGGEIGLEKYRSIYYCVPAPFDDISEGREREVIYGNYWETYPSDSNIMPMKIFVEEYHITREEFDRANLEWAKIIKEKWNGRPVIDPRDYANQEFDEVYNADIIYTFDDEIINEYYLSHDYPYCYESEYEEAIANGGYSSQSVKFIDVDQMEAEINAKYGEKETTAVIETTAE